ncbi:hypothetical protein UVI_02003590 [Ustilaginoidea virens]|uniref:Uncharacterized protein n=1 Tax=Ustilaginoidea virens TaxID=1159556 RepID=A0A1B5L0Z4_USTVR|nr:hypothetical protein UVI_02003590 [Ustilaginoidea virens]
MSKRVADENGSGPLKGGHRPDAMDIDDDDKDVGEFEDEFEDEFESEDEIFEAGVDGRPDAEREADEKAGKRNGAKGPTRKTKNEGMKAHGTLD